MRQNVLPRISCFDDVKFRRMINQCSGMANGPADYSDVQIHDPYQICHTRSMFDTPPDQTVHSIHSIHPTTTAPNIARRKVAISIQPATDPTPVLTKPSAILTPQFTSAAEFQNYMKDNYPLLAFNEIGIMLKYHTACGLQQANALKTTILQDNVRFLDKMASIMATTCICYSLQSLPCMLQKNDQCGGQATPNPYRRRLQMDDSDD